MFKRLTLALALTAALLPATAAEFPDYPFIHTSGSGYANVAPDLGEIDFEIVAFDPSPELARQAVEARIVAIRAVLDGAGVTATDIDVRDLRRELRKADPNQPGLVQYDIKCAVHIKITELSKWKAVVGPLIGMDNLDGFLVGFDSSRREQIEGELTADALKAARRRAEVIAAGIGRKLGLASAVSTGDLKNVTRAVGLGGVQPAAYRNPVRSDPDREGLLMVVPMKLSQSVDVIYRLK